MKKRFGGAPELKVGEVTKGHYHRKQLACRSSIIAWSHRSRFHTGCRLIGSSVPKLLDYGCGDGTFLALSAGQVLEGWGADIAAGQVADCRKRLVSFHNLRFCMIGDLADDSHTGAYSVVTCMETLEHCTAPNVEVALRDLARLVSPDGVVVISVPIEIGPTFLLKSVVRSVAAWRGLSDYSHYERYSVRNALRMIFATRSTALERPVYGEPEMQGHSHYGFNWRALRETVRSYLSVDRTLFSPVGILGGLISSQVWFVCRPYPIEQHRA